MEPRARLLEETQNLPRGDRERLFGWLEGSGKKILVEPDALLTESARLPGLDGQKMSKSYGNDISLREDADSVTKKDSHHAHGPGARKAHRSGQSGAMPGMAAASGVFGRGAQGLGAGKAAPAPASAASSASNR